MPVRLPGHGRCVCIVYKPAFEMMVQAAKLARARAADTTRLMVGETGGEEIPQDCSVQIAIDGATHRGVEKKTVIFIGWIGKILDRDRKRVCSNYNGLLKLVCQGESMNSAALIFELAQQACEKITGSKLTDYAKNVVKDDGRGLEAGLLSQMSCDGNADMTIWGNIISELFHRRRAFRKVFANLIGAELVDIISAGMNQTSNSQTSPYEFHVYWLTVLAR